MAHLAPLTNHTITNLVDIVKATGNAPKASHYKHKFHAQSPSPQKTTRGRSFHRNWVVAVKAVKKMTTIDKILKDQRAEGTATVMAIGTAVPSNCVQQTTYPDYYFRITNNEHKTELKHKFKRICKPTVLLSYFFLSG
ncbi:Chalcone synthase J, partial [Cucurbita argyrosperma subsp. argyrosperma]